MLLYLRSLHEYGNRQGDVIVAHGDVSMPRWCTCNIRLRCFWFAACVPWSVCPLEREKPIMRLLRSRTYRMVQGSTQGRHESLGFPA